ncbi:MAG: DsbA family protein [Cypionkella sp.]|nr:DsbA family protein [Cypionkella sp.]
MQVDYYFSVNSPYVYIGSARVAQMAAQMGAAWRYKPLHFAALAARMGSKSMTEADPARRAYFAQDLPRQAARAGLPILERPDFWPVNSAPASYAIIAAQSAVDKGEAGDLHALVAAICAAVWAQGRDIADSDVIAALMRDCGFDPAIADRGMFMAADTYARNVEDAAAAGAFGAPFIVAGEARFWGQDRLADAAQHLGLKVSAL